MSPFLADWLNLLLRWGHLIAGIGWIGTSFYFIALDLSLKRRQKMKPGVAGTAWEVHGGGFYHVEKYVVAPDDLPDDLIWFKWEAYLTWVTGMGLMLVQFYLEANVWMIDPSVMALEPWQAIVFSLASLAVGWLAYDGLCRSPLGRHTAALAAAVFVLIVAGAFVYTHVLSARAALVHTGALIGTLMAFNVFAIIIPGQKKVVASLIAGEKPDPRHGEIAKQRSVHNTYLTLPVLVMMVSGHYPFITGHPQAWLIVALVIVIGATARHLIIRHEVGDPVAKIAWTFPVIAAGLAAALWLSAPKARPVADIDVPDDVEIIAITQKHCVSCHAAKPTHEGFDAPPKNMVLETIKDIRDHAALIDRFAVKTETMPLGNETGMSEAERLKLGAWIAAQ